jgi:hypothetical protein
MKGDYWWKQTRVLMARISDETDLKSHWEDWIRYLQDEEYDRYLKLAPRAAQYYYNKYMNLIVQEWKWARNLAEGFLKQGFNMSIAFYDKIIEKVQWLITNWNETREEWTTEFINIRAELNTEVSDCVMELRGWVDSLYGFADFGYVFLEKLGNMFAANEEEDDPLDDNLEVDFASGGWLTEWAVSSDSYGNSSATAIKYLPYAIGSVLTWVSNLFWPDAKKVAIRIPLGKILSLLPFDFLLYGVMHFLVFGVFSMTSYSGTFFTQFLGRQISAIKDALDSGRHFELVLIVPRLFTIPFPLGKPGLVARYFRSNPCMYCLEPLSGPELANKKHYECSTCHRSLLDPPIIMTVLDLGLIALLIYMKIHKKDTEDTQEPKKKGKGIGGMFGFMGQQKQRMWKKDVTEALTAIRSVLGETGGVQDVLDRIGDLDPEEQSTVFDLLTLLTEGLSSLTEAIMMLEGESPFVEALNLITEWLLYLADPSHREPPS